jgi:hypothetical protein
LGNATVKKLTKEEEVDKIKQRLENLPTTASPDIGKLLGQRRPAIYTPKEQGVSFFEKIEMSNLNILF